MKRLGKGPRYRVLLKRRRKKKTDYRQRKIMNLSNLTRLVIRGSLRNMTAQVVKAYSKGDQTLVTVSTQQLRKYGWKASTGNTSAAYLTGLLVGYQARSIGINYATPDIGLRRASPGSRIFAVIKGANDAGLEVPYGDVIPGESRVKGEHIAFYALELAKIDPGMYERRFSSYLSENLKPEELPVHFEAIKSNILNQLNGND